MIEMNLRLAERITTTALSRAKKMNVAMSVSVVDEAGRLVFYSRMDGAGFYTFDTSRAKAAIAASFRRATLEISKVKEGNPLLWYSLPAVIPGQALPSPGGVPVFRNEYCIGAVGIGGGSPEQDHECACLAARVAEDDSVE